jgi:nucleotidyltransferase substrate binding protein (TIGR01987 family)
LSEALDVAHNKFEIAGAIQAFEVCYEITWKTLKKILSLNSIEVIGARDVFRLTAQKGLIADHKPWFDYQNKRNITVHEYYDEIEKKVYPILPSFLQDLDKLIEKLKQLK